MSKTNCEDCGRPWEEHGSKMSGAMRVKVCPTIEPQSDLGKLLLRLTELAAGHDPMGFKDIHLDKAIEQADAAADLTTR